jgi:signal transduction histidine kinase/ligand-binding sensor domain-containing protein
VTVHDGGFTPETRHIRLAEGDRLSMWQPTTNGIVFLAGRGDLFSKSFDTPAGAGWSVVTPPFDVRNASACPSGTGDVWYRNGNESRLWRVHQGQWQAVPASAGLAEATVGCLAADSQGRAWVGMKQGIFAEQAGVFHPVIVPGGAESWSVSSLLPQTNGEVWAVVNGGLGRAAAGQWVVPPVAERALPGVNLDAGRMELLADGRGGVWLYNYGAGLWHCTAAGHLRHLTSADGFPGDRVFAFCADREGDWWAGLESGGLVRVRERLFHTATAGPRELVPVARSVAADRDGSVWLGTLGSGLFHWQDGAWQPDAAFRRAGLSSVFCVGPDQDHRLWLSADNENLYVEEGGQVELVDPLVHGVKSLLVDRSGRVWIGTTAGLFVTDTGRTEDIHQVDDEPGRYVRALAEDADGGLWGGTGSGDLFHLVHGNCQTFHPPDLSRSDAIWSLQVERDGTVWAGTFRGGLLRFRNGRFTRFDKSNGLPDNVISQILDDGSGHLWLGSHQGVFCLTKGDLENFSDPGRPVMVSPVSYGRSDGLPSVECSGGYQPAAGVDAAGRFWFATARGAAWIRPEGLAPNHQLPPVVIEEVVVDGVSQPQRSGELVLPPGRHQVEFRYTGLSLAAPERVQFRRRLEGSDSGWVLAGNQREAQYNALPPGQYRFRVIACNSDGLWNESGASVTVRIRPHFYETWWCQLGSLAALVGGVAAWVRHAATRRLRLQMRELERVRILEQERARIAKDIHDDLGASLTLIAVLGDLARKDKLEDPVRAGERVEKMSGTARAAVKSLDEIVWAVNPRNDTLSHLIDYTGQFAADYLRDAGVRCRLDVPEFVPLCELSANVRHNLFLVVKEALQNIVKHAGASEAWLRIRFEDEVLTVAVEDNGRGFEPGRAGPGADGLRNMRQRLAEIGGTCRIESGSGRGTVITFEASLQDGPAQTFIR